MTQNEITPARLRADGWKRKVPGDNEYWEIQANDRQPGRNTSLRTWSSFGAGWRIAIAQWEDAMQLGAVADMDDLRSIVKAVRGKQ
jgi:hypothetical protein